MNFISLLNLVRDIKGFLQILIISYQWNLHPPDSLDKIITLNILVFAPHSLTSL